MGTLPDITTLLRQKELMSGMGRGSPQQNFAAQQIVSNPQAALIQDALKYGTRGGAPATAPVDNSVPAAPKKGLGDNSVIGQAMAKVPGLSTAQDALGNLRAKIAGALTTKPTPAPNPAPAPINNVQQQPYTPQPTLRQRDSTMGGSTGFQLQMGPDGNIAAVPMSTTPELQQQARQYNPNLDQ